LQKKEKSGQSQSRQCRERLLIALKANDFEPSTQEGFPQVPVSRIRTKIVCIRNTVRKNFKERNLPFVYSLYSSLVQLSVSCIAALSSPPLLLSRLLRIPRTPPKHFRYPDLAILDLAIFMELE
jgi:hypothetical protein